ATLSPARIRMKFLRIFPETCAKTWCLFSSSTRNMAFGRGSITVAMTSMASSFELPESFFFLSSSGLAISSRNLPLLQKQNLVPLFIRCYGVTIPHFRIGCKTPLPGRAGYFLGPRQDLRTIGRHGDSVLEMG